MKTYYVERTRYVPVTEVYRLIAEDAFRASVLIPQTSGDTIRVIPNPTKEEQRDAITLFTPTS